MPSISFYFQVHQPFRLKNYSFFDIGNDHFYENEGLNREILDKVSAKCYLKANETILNLINKHNGKFKVAYSISGVALKQFELYRPDVLESFQKLAETGCVEFLGETYNHSLSFLYSKEEFLRQVKQHEELIIKHFNQIPKVFRNTELIYNNELAWYLDGLGYSGVVAEGVDHLLYGRTPNFVYQAAGSNRMKVLLKNYKLSDDIAFRFSNKEWAEHPLSSEKFASWCHNVAGNGEVINLFMDYETFGEHQWEDTGIFQFLEHLPEAVFRHPDFDFKTPSEVISSYSAKGVYDCHNFTSWADQERDLSAWLSNPMQWEAMDRIYSIEKDVKELNDENILSIWERLQTSDHFYYMCTKFWSDGDVHKYFSHYPSPYEAYMNFMNVFCDLEVQVSNMLEAKREAQKGIPLKTSVSTDALIGKSKTAKKVYSA